MTGTVNIDEALVNEFQAQIQSLQQKVFKLPAYACIKVESTGLSTITGSFQAVNDAAISGGLTWSLNINSTLIREDLTNGSLDIEEDMTVHAVIAFSYTPDDTSTTEIELTIGIDSGAGIVTREVNIKALNSTTATTETGNLTLACIPKLKKGDKVYLMVRRNSGTADITIKACNMTLHRVE